METYEKIEHLLTDIRIKADLLLVDNEEARYAGVSDGSMPYLGFKKEDITQTEAWKQVKAEAELEFEKTMLEQRKKYFQTLMRKSVINQWIEKNLGMKGGTDFAQLRSAIEYFVAADRIPALKLYLSDVLTHGQKVAEKNVKKRRTGGWAWLGYSFAVIKGLIYVAAVLAILSIAESHFQKIALVILILIGNAAIGRASRVPMLFVEVHEILDKQFYQLRLFFRLPEEDDEREARQEARATADIQLARTGINNIIQSVFEGIVWLICAVELVLVFLR